MEIVAALLVIPIVLWTIMFLIAEKNLKEAQRRKAQQDLYWKTLLDRLP